MQGSKLKKSSGRHLANNWRNIVTRCKFLVVSFYNVNDAAQGLLYSRGRKAVKFTKAREICVCTTYLKFISANLSWNFVTETCKRRPETTRCRLCCDKLGTSHDVKGFAIGSFLERIVVERANDDLCWKTLKGGPEGGVPVPFASPFFFWNPTSQCSNPIPTSRIWRKSQCYTGLYFPVAVEFAMK